MSRGKKREGNVEVNKPLHKLGKENRDVVIALKMMFVEIGGLNLKNKQKVAEWFYSIYKSDRFENTTFGSKNGDPNAHKLADTFRNSFAHQSEQGEFTVDFLTKVVLALRIFGPFTGWDDFQSLVANTYDLYVEAHESIYQKICEQADIIGVEIPRELFFPWHYVDYVYQSKILLNNVAIYIGNDKPRLIAAQSYNRTVLFAENENELNTLEIYDRSITLFPRAIEYEKSTLFEKHNSLFYYTVGVFPLLPLDAISLIPLNGFGHWHLKYGRLFNKTITPNMICGPDSIEKISCIYVDCSTGVLGLGVLSEFSHYLATLITRLVGLAAYQIPIYIADDSAQKKEIILRYNLLKTNIETGIDFLYETNANEGKSLSHIKTGYCLYQIKLDKFWIMKYSLGQTDFSFE